MCIIAAKPAGVKMPAQTTIETMWCRNHDGAGFMYAQGGVVHIEKGFMKLDDFNKALDRVRKTIDLDAVPVVLHFRIATHGGVNASNTHPFPVTTSVGTLQKLVCNTTLGVAHNGIIPSVSPRKGLSDTMEYIVSQLGPLYKGVPEFYTNKHLMTMIDNAVGSRLAFLTHKGELYTVGHFEENDGIMYSNSSYKPSTFELYGYDSKWSNLAGRFDEYDMYEALGYAWSGHRMVQWLFKDDCRFVNDAKGHTIYNDDYDFDFAVDSDGKVYRYNYEIDGLVLVPGGRSYDANGKQVFADAEASVLEEIYTEDDTPWEEPKPIITLPLKGKAKKTKKASRK